MRRYYRAVEVAGAGGMAMMAGGSGTGGGPAGSAARAAGNTRSIVVHQSETQRALPEWQRKPKELTPAQQHANWLVWVEVLQRWMREDAHVPGAVEFYQKMLESTRASLRAWNERQGSAE